MLAFPDPIATPGPCTSRVMPRRSEMVRAQAPAPRISPTVLGSLRARARARERTGAEHPVHRAGVPLVHPPGRKASASITWRGGVRKETAACLHMGLPELGDLPLGLVGVLPPSPRVEHLREGTLPENTGSHTPVGSRAETSWPTLPPDVDSATSAITCTMSRRLRRR